MEISPLVIVQGLFLLAATASDRLTIAYSVYMCKSLVYGMFWSDVVYVGPASVTFTTRLIRSLKENSFGQLTSWLRP